MGKSKRTIKKNKWYIVALTKRDRKGHYKLLNREFDNKVQATTALKKHFEDKVYLFEVIRGDKAIEFQFKFLGQGPHYFGTIEKYDYPPEREAGQPKKSFRTKFRRWKRDYKRELTKIWA